MLAIVTATSEMKGLVTLIKPTTRSQKEENESDFLATKIHSVASHRRPDVRLPRKSSTA